MMKDVNTELTEAQIKLLQKAGYLPETDDEIEINLWLAVRDSGAADLLDYVAAIQDATGWDDRSAKQFSRNTWKTAQKLIAAR